MEAGTLYLCATPIGNLEDITLRVLRTLREADLVAAEDTRQARKLLDHFGIATPMVSYHAHNQRTRGEELLARLRAGEVVALVSDAGTPGISDPGALLATHAVAAGIPVVALPGASAVLTALVVAGLPTARFVFEGFLPRKGRAAVLADLAKERRTIVLYESPRRLLRTLEELRDAWGDRRVAVARELTKMFEEVFRGTLSEALTYFTQKGEPRGEFTLVVQGTPQKAAAPADVQELRQAVQALVSAGTERRAAVREVARRFGCPRREVYNLTLQDRDDDDAQGEAGAPRKA